MKGSKEKSSSVKLYGDILEVENVVYYPSPPHTHKKKGLAEFYKLMQFWLQSLSLDTLSQGFC